MVIEHLPEHITEESIRATLADYGDVQVKLSTAPPSVAKNPILTHPCAVFCTRSGCFTIATGGRGGMRS